jgi:sec-independent protein translocase protein TatC
LGYNKETTITEHFLELRNRLLFSLLFFIASFVICYIFADEIYQILLQPLIDAIKLHHNNQENININQHRLIYTSPAEAFTTYIRMALWSAIFISFPIFIAEIYLFIAPGLYKKEKSIIIKWLIISPLLFILGALIAYFIIAPLALEFFLAFEKSQSNNQILQLQLETRISEYLKLILNLILGFGIAFQMPLILAALLKFNIISLDSLINKRRYFIVVIFIISAILTPPDIISQITMAMPLLLMFEAVIIVAKINNRNRYNISNEHNS